MCLANGRLNLEKRRDCRADVITSVIHISSRNQTPALRLLISLVLKFNFTAEYIILQARDERLHIIKF